MGVGAGGRATVLALSPESSRGFSGEGGVLWDLADEDSADDADLVSALLAFEPRIDVARLSAEAGCQRIGSFGLWAGSGRLVGWDTTPQRLLTSTASCRSTPTDLPQCIRG